MLAVSCCPVDTGLRACKNPVSEPDRIDISNLEVAPNLSDRTVAAEAVQYSKIRSSEIGLADLGIEYSRQWTHTNLLNFEPAKPGCAWR